MKICAILNADDFGLSPGINRGIIEAYRDGILTSASLMVVGDAFEEAVALAHEHPDLSLGIHLTLLEGIPVLPPEKIPSLVTSDGRFFGSLRKFLLKWLTRRLQMEEIRQEFGAQIEKALNQGIRIDKLDSHMHLHLLPGIFQTVLAVAKRYRVRAIRLPKEQISGQSNLPEIAGLGRQAILTSLAAFRARPIAAAGLFHPARFSGIAESGRLTEEALLRLLRSLQPGVTEVMIHPGYPDSIVDGWPMSRRYEREQELRALTSPAVKALARNLQIRLASYRTLLEGQDNMGGGPECGTEVT
jgi:hopanoid biosynthesis associated protein HpnK